MKIAINKAKVDGLVKVCSLVIAREFRDASALEVLIAMSQLVGRLIAVQEGTPVLHNDMVRLAHSQIFDTVKAGYAHKGRDSGGITK